jgi:hypothetical protein
MVRDAVLIFVRVMGQAMMAVSLAGLMYMAAMWLTERRY